MPGRTPAEAFQDFVDPLASALACVGACKLTPSPGGRGDTSKPHQLLVNGGERLRLGGPAHLELGIRMKYRFREQPELDNGPWKIQTLAYSYTMVDSAGTEIVSFHWHPQGTSHAGTPHLHVGNTQLREDAVLTSKQHVPTGRIALEQVIHSLIAEYEVPARVGDWESRLALTRGVFELYRSWSASPPAPDALA